MSSIHAPQTELPADLVDQVVQCGFYPELVLDSIAIGLGQATPVGFLVHHQTSFAGQGIQRHTTVLVLTETQLLICHTDDNDGGKANRALTSTEVVALRAIDAVTVTRSIASPDQFGSNASVHETWLSIVWGAERRLDFGPASCEDPTCEGEHGYTGMQVANDLTVRMSQAADSNTKTEQLLEFGALLQRRIG